MDPTASRVLRVALPVTLLRDMDAVILSGVGGYTTRAEFIVDSVQERILELTVEDEEDAAAPLAQFTNSNEPMMESSPSPARALDRRTDLTVTTLPRNLLAPAAPADLTLSTASSSVMFGLHNRDYPSLWALTQLERLAAAGPVDIESFYDDVLKRAWEFGAILYELERETGEKFTALFPTNRAKPKAAEGRFRAFAIGDVRPDKVGALTASGPLFQWQAAGYVARGGEAKQIGVTSNGLELLDLAAGITVAEPHSADVARRFFDFLARNSTGDWKGFTETLLAIDAQGAKRQDVLSHFAACWPKWTPNEVATNAMGYIARAREWGLIEPKQINSKYHLTELGSEMKGVIR